MAQLATMPSVGETVAVRNTVCTVRFVGETHFAEGTWIGVEFATAIGRNDGSVESEQYFTCPPRHGLFVRLAQVHSAEEAAPRIERDAPEKHVHAWNVMENVLEAEAIQAGLAGDRVLRHLKNLHPKEAAAGGEPGTPSRRMRAGEFGSKKRQPTGAVAKQEVAGTGAPSASADIDVALRERYATLPADYVGPTLEGGPTAEGMAQLLRHIKAHIARSDSPSPAVPAKLAVALLIGARQRLEETASSLVELSLSEGRIVVVGDTHGQLNDFCWILKAHGPPSAGNVYLVNGDVADRGGYAVEIYLLLLGYMLACPGCVHINRGNHESFDMNVRAVPPPPPLAAALAPYRSLCVPAVYAPRSLLTAALMDRVRRRRLRCMVVRVARGCVGVCQVRGFLEGGGFATEVGAKYDADVFALFQSLFNLLPLATRINSEVLVLHGGLCRSGSATLDQLRAVERRRPVPVSTADPRDLLFFDTMWADPQEAPGISRSLARGSVCVTFGPDITRRFCEINRLRMIIRSHEVPRSMSGVAVQHDGRLITVFSASNYCGRIGNTGGTMLLTPSLNYQLMEHWSPSLDELVRIEAEEEAASANGGEPPEPQGPVQLRRQFSADAELMMQADVLDKLKDLICAHTSELRLHFEQLDHAGTGAVSIGQWADALRAIVRGGAALPWEDYVGNLATKQADETISYRAFLCRYRISPGAAAKWQSRLLSSMCAPSDPPAPTAPCVHRLPSAPCPTSLSRPVCLFLVFWRGP